MAVKLSTGLGQFLNDESGLRKAFEDAILNIYSGTPPATADAIAPAANLLCKITIGSGAVVTTSRTDRSIPKLKRYTMSGTRTAGKTCSVKVTLADATTAHYVFTIHATSASLRTTTAVTREFAQMLDDIPQLSALSMPGATTGKGNIILVKSRIAGLSFEIAQRASTGPTISTGTLITTASRVNTLQFGKPVAGVISKASGTWSGLNLATGVAGWFRLVAPEDDATLSTTQVRLQGACAASGAEINMSNTTLTEDATCTIDTFSVTLPLLV